MSPTAAHGRGAAARSIGATVVLHDVQTRTEHRALIDWVSAEHPLAPVIGLSDDWVAEAFDDETLMVPARVIWASPADRGHGNVLAHLSPRRPWAAVQPLLARRTPASLRIVSGEPATLGELRKRFKEDSSATGSLEAYVAHAAGLASDRAERRLVGDRYKVPRRVAEQIAGSTQFRGSVTALADKVGRQYDEVFAEARSCLDELATSLSPAAIDAFRAVLAPMHSRAWKVHVDQASLEPLRALNKNHALVFLPAHRSYVDPLVLGEVLHIHDFPRNHILGGNNMAIWPIGPLGKRAGVVFIRRTNADNAVYKLALREYLAHLAAKRFNLEWYIEGGRTRTGKLRPPKFGLLAYLTQALKAGRTDDVQLVPVSIIYDHMHEVGALSAEQGGATKAAEGSRWLARYVTGQLRNRGNAWVNFGEPFSLRDALTEAGEGKAQLEKVAFRICDGINRATPMTPTALVTFALLGAHDRALTLAEVSRVAVPLLDYLESRGINGPGHELRTEPGLTAALNQLVDVGVATHFNGGTESLWEVKAGQHRVAAFYRNGALHHLVTRAIVELAMLHIANRQDTKQSPNEAAWNEALRLRDLLKFEFFFPPTEQFRADVIAELELIDPAWRQRSATEAGAEGMLAASPILVAHRALRSFFDAQLVVAEALCASAEEPIEEAIFLEKCLGLGEQMLRRGQLHRADSVSRELYATAFNLAGHRGLLADGCAIERDEFALSVRQILERVGHIAALEDARLEGVNR